MAGTFPGTSNTQQIDANGKPLIGGNLTVFNGGSQVLASCFQDIGLTLPGPNPMPLDATGRVPLFYVADGTYRIRLTDSSGVTTNGGFDLPTVPSIGASTSGGGGPSVDPTTILSTGDIKWQLIQGIISGWVRLNGRTIGDATSGATERANADTQALFVYIWSNFLDAICPVVGGRGASAIADFNANKQITVFDMRGSAPFGLDDMGNIAANELTGAEFDSGNSTTAGSKGGEAAHLLAKTELPVLGLAPAYTPPSNIDASITLNSSNNQGAVAGWFAGAGGTPTQKGNSSIPISGGAVSIPEVGGGLTHNTMPPFALGTWFWKL